MALGQGSLWRSDGEQKSGTALRYGYGNAYIYNQSGQIYPKEVTQSLGNNSFGGFSGTGYRNNAGSDSYYQYGGAFQGAKSVSKSDRRMRQCWGFFRPSGIPRYSNLVRVDYVRISIGVNLNTRQSSVLIEQYLYILV